MGFTEILFLAIIALIFIGPKQLPEVARVLARMINEFKRATGDLGASLTQARSEADQFLQETEHSLTEPQKHEAVAAETSQERADSGSLSTASPAKLPSQTDEQEPTNTKPNVNRGESD